MTDSAEKIAEGREAQTLRDNRLLRAIFTKITAETREKWEGSPAAAQDERERLYLKIQVVRQVQAEIHSLVNTGKIAETEIAKAEARRGRPPKPRA